MKIAEYVGNNIVIIEPHGRLTMETIQYFRRAVARRIDQGWSGVIVDLQNIDYIDRRGLARWRPRIHRADGAAFAGAGARLWKEP